MSGLNAAENKTFTKDITAEEYFQEPFSFFG